MNAPLNRNTGLAALALLTSAGTLVCCVLPAVMVALGAGAALAGLVTAVPQLVWLSEHKGLVFGIAGIMLAVAGVALWRARRSPCPTDPALALACIRLRRWSAVTYGVAVAAFATGATFAFVLPAFAGEGIPERQVEVRERGAEVMTFSLGATLHVFEKTASGGTQRVLAREGHDDQVPMVRGHLSSIAKAFASRDFSGPSHVHGESMPGLTELKTAPAGDLDVAFEEIEHGAQVTYTARTHALVEAVHRWFDSQLADHGHDAADHGSR